MIDAQTGAEHLPQPVHHLHGQGYLGQEIEHLLALTNHLMDEMDIDLGLARRSDSMEQRHRFLTEGIQNLAESLLLGLTQRTEGKSIGKQVGLCTMAGSQPFGIFQLGWYRSLHHITDRAHVIFADPFPQPVLALKHHG